MVTLQDIDNALARVEALMPRFGLSPQQDEQVTCLANAREMLRDLGNGATAALERMTSTLDALSDITKAP